jgi:hypothetical protein
MAALYAAREGMDTLLIERAAMGGQAAATQWLDNVPGFAEGIEGAAYSDQLGRQAVRFGVELLQAQDVVRVHSPANYRCADTADGSQYSAHALLLATGSLCGRCWHAGGLCGDAEERWLHRFYIEDQRGALLEMVDSVRRKLLGVELAAGLGKLDLGDLDLSEGKRLARRAVELIEGSVVGYTLIAAIKE